MNPPIGFKWKETGAVPSPVRITPMAPKPARRLFLDAFRRLEAGRLVTFEWLGSQGAVDPASIPEHLTDLSLAKKHGIAECGISPL